MPAASEIGFYLPSLDKCLNDCHRIMFAASTQCYRANIVRSWNLAYKTLLNADYASKCSNIQSFLSDAESIEILRRDFEPFETPTPQTKSSFEERIAPINIAHSNDEAYSIEQFKRDVEWLSAQAKISEVAALRIVILEWQNRHAARILSGYTEEESISIQKAVSGVSPGISAGISSETSDDFDSEDRRQERLLRTFLEERCSIIDIKALLAIDALGLPEAPAGRTYGFTGSSNRSHRRLFWLAEIHRQVKHERTQSDTELSILYPKSLSERLSRLESGSGWTLENTQTPAFQAYWLTIQLREILAILQSLYAFVCSEKATISDALLQQWFEFLDNYNFLENLTSLPTEVQITVGQTHVLLSLISCQMLDLSSVLTSFEDASSNPPQLQPDCRYQITQTLFGAARQGSKVSSLAVFTWSVVLQNVRSIVQSELTDTISDDDSSPVASRPTALTRYSNSAQEKLNGTYDQLITVAREFDIPDDVDVVQHLARIAFDEMGVLDIIVQLASSLHLAFATPWGVNAELHARIQLLELVRQGLNFTFYGSDIVEAALAVLDVETASGPQAKQYLQANIIDAFINDHAILVPNLLQQVQARYPYELRPLLKLSKVLSAPMGLNGVDTLNSPSVA